MGLCPIAIRLISLVGKFAIKVIAVSWLVSKHLLTLCDTEWNQDFCCWTAYFVNRNTLERLPVLRDLKFKGTGNYIKSRSSENTSASKAGLKPSSNPQSHQSKKAYIQIFLNCASYSHCCTVVLQCATIYSRIWSQKQTNRQRYVFWALYL